MEGNYDTKEDVINYALRVMHKEGEHVEDIHSLLAVAKFWQLRKRIVAELKLAEMLVYNACLSQSRMAIVALLAEIEALEGKGADNGNARTHQ